MHALRVSFFFWMSVTNNKKLGGSGEKSKKILVSKRFDFYSFLPELTASVGLLHSGFQISVRS